MVAIDAVPKLQGCFWLSLCTWSFLLWSLEEYPSLSNGHPYSFLQHPAFEFFINWSFPDLKIDISWMIGRVVWHYCNKTEERFSYPHSHILVARSHISTYTYTFTAPRTPKRMRGGVNETFLYKYPQHKKETPTPIFVSYLLYIFILISVLYYYIVPFMGNHHGHGEMLRNFKGGDHFEVAVPFSTTLYISSCLIYWSNLKWIKAPNAAISSGTKAEKSTTPMVPSPTRIAGRCESAQGTFSDLGLLSCYSIASPKTEKTQNRLEKIFLVSSPNLRWYNFLVSRGSLLLSLRQLSASISLVSLSYENSLLIQTRKLRLLSSSQSRLWLIRDRKSVV